jgi:hypothetical protein
VPQRKRRAAPTAQRKPLSEDAIARETILMRKGVTKTEIARAIGVAPQTINALILGANRSIGSLELEVVNYLNTKGGERVTPEMMRWPQPEVASA